MLAQSAGLVGMEGRIPLNLLPKWAQPDRTSSATFDTSAVTMQPNPDTTGFNVANVVLSYIAGTDYLRVLLSARANAMTPTISAPTFPVNLALSYPQYS